MALWYCGDMADAKNVRIPSSSHDLARALAFKERRTIGAVIADALRQYRAKKA